MRKHAARSSRIGSVRVPCPGWHLSGAWLLLRGSRPRTDARNTSNVTHGHGVWVRWLAATAIFWHRRLMRGRRCGRSRNFEQRSQQRVHQAGSRMGEEHRPAHPRFTDRSDVACLRTGRDRLRRHGRSHLSWHAEAELQVPRYRRRRLAALPYDESRARSLQAIDERLSLQPML